MRRRARRKNSVKMDNTGDIDLILEKNKLIQDILGFSQEKITDLFSHGIDLLHQGHYDEAAKAFSLLTRINPYVADFWLGLGLAHFNNEEYPKAFEVMSVALAMDQSRCDVYVYAIDCCLQMGRIGQAEALLKEAVSYARRHKNNSEAQIILQEAGAIKQKIQEHKEYIANSS